MKIGRRISNGSSVLAAELMAILWALWWIEEASPREALICSDSAAALETLRAGKSEARPDIVNDILSGFYRVGFACNITFCWVPGHAGVLGNEQADYIAKDSLGREIDIYIPLGRVELRERVKECLIKEWQNGWEKEIKGRHYFSIQPKVRKKCFCTFPSRRDSVKLCRLRLGHCGLNYFLHIIGKHISGLCECGNMETIGHVFLECRKYNVERRTLFCKLAEIGLKVFSVTSLFGHSDKHKQISEAVIQFLHETGLYLRI